MTRSALQVTQSALNSGVELLAVRGELDLATAPQLSEPLECAVDGDGSGVLIDLSECEFIDSTGLGELLRAYRQLASKDGGHGQLMLVCDRNEVLRVLQIAGVDLLLPVFATLDEAVEALGSDGASGRGRPPAT